MKLLLYCTKAKPILYKPFEWDCFPNDEASRFYLGDSKTIEIDEELNGKIVAECDFRVEEIKYHFGYYDMGEWTESYILENSCLTAKELDNYLQAIKEYDEAKVSRVYGYAIHIKNLTIFYEPKELNDYYKTSKINTFDGYDLVDESIDKAPQNMMYCYDEKDEKYVLISIQPKWLCKILNGEKTIEVRKKVLKEMVGNE